MISKLPEEIISYILKKVDTDPISFLNMRNINRQCRVLIDSYEDIYYDKITMYEKEMHQLCRKNTSVQSYEWLMKNNIHFSLNNLRSLIIANRSDVIRRGFYYKQFLDVLFNRFYIQTSATSNIFSFIECGFISSDIFGKNIPFFLKYSEVLLTIVLFIDISYIIFISFF